MWKFSLRQFLLGTTAICLACFSLAWTHNEESRFSHAACMTIWLLGGTLLGAGMLAPFGRAILGAILGFILQAVILYWFIDNWQFS